MYQPREPLAHFLSILGSVRKQGARTYLENLSPLQGHRIVPAPAKQPSDLQTQAHHASQPHSLNAGRRGWRTEHTLSFSLY